jgi:hypothetical protein
VSKNTPSQRNLTGETLDSLANAVTPDLLFPIRAGSGDQQSFLGFAREAHIALRPIPTRRGQRESTSNSFIMKIRRMDTDEENKQTRVWASTFLISLMNRSDLIHRFHIGRVGVGQT